MKKLAEVAPKTDLIEKIAQNLYLITLCFVEGRSAKVSDLNSFILETEELIGRFLK